MIIAAHAVGARRGYIYVRGEYPYAFKVMGDALEEARQAGAIGGNIPAPDWTSTSKCGWVPAPTLR
jgi:NADH:ubiquinone oxidoreductase subunit F (NADH-binding)